MATYSPVPSSTVQSATGASYTVAAGFYAIARLCVNAGGSFNVNGVTVLSCDTWSAINSANGLFRAPGTPSSTGTSAGIAGALVDNPAGWSTSINGSAVPVYGNSTAAADLTTSLTLVAGDIIVGSGTARYHIEVYPL
jgi:hypothetical protein